MAAVVMGTVAEGMAAEGRSMSGPSDPKSGNESRATVVAATEGTAVAAMEVVERTTTRVGGYADGKAALAVWCVCGDAE